MNSFLVIDNNGVLNKKIVKITSDFSTFNSLGYVTNYDDAMNIILKSKPDIVFFNLDNVFENNFLFVQELYSYLDIVPDFVAVSKTKDFAYDSIKNNFIDYLINPISELELRKLLLKFKKKQSSQKNRMLCLKSYKDYHYLNIKDILFLKADNNTTDFYIKDGSVVNAFKTLKIFENTLPNNFLRIHKSYIVNIDFVSRINFGKLKCTIDSSSYKLPFTKTYINNIEFINNSLSGISVLSQN